MRVKRRTQKISREGSVSASVNIIHSLVITDQFVINSFHSLTDDFHGCGRLCLPVGVPGGALVDSVLLRVDLEEVQGDVVKVVGRAVLVAC